MGGRHGGHTTRAGRFGRTSLAVVLLAMLSLGQHWQPPVAHAATFTVTTTADAAHTSPLNGSCTSTLAGNPCTLRAAMQAANFLGGGPHTITVPAGTYTLTIAGSDNVAAVGDLDVVAGANVAIRGAGAAATVVQAGPTPGSGIDAVFTVQPGGALTITGATIRHGSSSGLRIQEENPGSPEGRLTLDRVVLSNNNTSQFNGEGGAIRSEGALRITNSAIIGNSSTGNGAAIYQNTANSSPVLTNVTISGNANTGSQAQRGIVAYADSTPPFLLRNVTIVGNKGFALSGLPMEVSNSIVARNSEGCFDFFTTAQNFSAGHNLTDTGEGCDRFLQPGDVRNADPRLGPLQDNGGGTLTHALLAGSPAIDRGNNIGCPSVDQRGLPRPRDGDGDGRSICDIGAFEVQPPPVGTFTLAPGTANVAVGQRQAAVLTWTVTEGKSWQTLRSVQVRLREDDRASGGSDEAHTALQFQWDEVPNTVREVDPKTGRLGPPAALGSETVLESARAALYLKESSIKGGGRERPDVVAFTMSLGFKPPTKGRTYTVEVAATNDSGTSQDFAPAGTITVDR